MTTKVKIEQVMQLLEKHPRNPAGNTYLEHDAPYTRNWLDKKILRKLVALAKPDGSVRPIGVGAARRRLTGKVTTVA